MEDETDDWIKLVRELSYMTPEILWQFIVDEAEIPRIVLFKGYPAYERKSLKLWAAELMLYPMFLDSLLRRAVNEKLISPYFQTKTKNNDAIYVHVPFHRNLVSEANRIDKAVSDREDELRRA